MFRGRCHDQHRGVNIASCGDGQQSALVRVESSQFKVNVGVLGV